MSREPPGPSGGEVLQCPLVLPHRKDNLQVVQHFNLPREALLAPAHHVVLTEGSHTHASARSNDI